MLLIKMSCALYTVARVCVLNDDILCTFMMVKIRIFILFVLFVSFSTREKRDEFFSLKRKRLLTRLTAEAVQGAALALERVDDIHGGDGLSAGVLGVRHRIADHVFEEHLEDTSGLFVDETRDALDATTARETADRRLRDALDVVAQHLAVTLGATLPETFTTFTATGHCEYVLYLFLNDDLNGRFRFVFRVFLCFFVCFVGVTSQFCYRECI